MQDVKTFNTYNFVTGAVDGTLAYDFGVPGYYQDEEVYELPRQRGKRRAKAQQQEWIKEDVRSVARERVADNRQGISIVSMLGAIVAVVMLTMMLLAQIRLTNIADTAAQLENRISILETERDKLTVEYETIFNLKDVEEYAVNELGMQEPDNEQIYYLTGVASADKAVVITRGDADMFSLGLSDLLNSVKAYFG